MDNVKVGDRIKIINMKGEPLPKACRERFPGWALLLWGRIHIHKGKRIFSYQ